MTQGPVKKAWAQAYANHRAIIIDTHSGYWSATLDPQGKHYVLHASASHGVIGTAVLDALALSRFLPPGEVPAFFHPEATRRNYDSWVQSLLDSVGLKTRRALFQRMDLCTIQRSESCITITPWHHKKLEYWTGEGITEEDSVQAAQDTSPEAIGAALKLAFSRCT